MSCTIPNRIQSPSETYEQSTICTSIDFLDLCALTKPIKVHLQHTGASLGLDLHSGFQRSMNHPVRLITDQPHFTGTRFWFGYCAALWLDRTKDRKSLWWFMVSEFSVWEDMGHKRGLFTSWLTRKQRVLAGPGWIWPSKTTSAVFLPARPTA